MSYRERSRSRFAGWWALLCIVMLSVQVQAANRDQVQIEPVESWVNAIPFQTPASVPHEQLQDGEYTLLQDLQTRATAGITTTYYHYATLIDNPSGLQQNSSITLGFYPRSQSLTLHYVRIIRDGQQLDRTPQQPVALLSQDEELADTVYGGKLTTNILLDDLRVGDVIEYAFTRTSDNQPYPEQDWMRIRTQYTVPVQQKQYRLLWLRPEVLQWDVTGPAVQVTTATVPGGKEYSLQLQHPEPVRSEKGTPDWYSRFGAVTFAPQYSWQQVVQQVLPSFAKAMQEDSALQPLAATIRQQHRSVAELCAAALSYVQSQLRYVELDMDAKDLPPSAVNTILQRGYADSVDKAVVLTALLRQLGIEAAPALVSGWKMQLLPELMPSVWWLDHALVQVQLAGKQYWLDPSLSYQQGALDDIFQPDYGYALVLSEATTAPSAMQVGSNHHSRYTEHFDLSKGPQAAADYTSETLLQGFDAEQMRGMLARQSVADKRTDYLNFYQDYYPGIEVVQPASFTNVEGKNQFRIKEHYVIPEIWQKTDKGHEVFFYAFNLEPMVKKIKDTARTSPLALPFPLNIDETIEVKLDGGWSLDDGYFEEDNPFFYFSRKSSFSKRQQTLTLQFTYRAKVSWLAAQDVSAYVKARARMAEKAEYGLFIEDNDAAESAPASTANDKKNADTPESLGMQLFGCLILLHAMALLYGLVQSYFEGREAPARQAQFYPVAVWKLVLLTGLTWTFYLWYWHYQNWRYVREQLKVKVLPGARALFSPLFFFSLGLQVRKVLAASPEAGSSLSVTAVVLGAVVYLLLTLAQCMSPESFYLVILFNFCSGLAHASVARAIKRLNSAASTARNSVWRLRHSLILLTYLLLMAFLLANQLGWLPDPLLIPIFRH